MSKSFQGGINTLLGEKEEEQKRPKGRPRTNFKEITKTSQIGAKEGETRTTFIISEDHLAKMKALAYYKRVTIKDVFARAIEDYLEKNKSDIPQAIKTFNNKTTA
jgi:hypothetical protein